MATDSESPIPADDRARPLEPRPPRKKKKAKKAKLSRPLEEREINAPDAQTLWMLGILAALAVVLWIFAHAGCNYHPPSETRRPRTVSTADLTRESKDAAIELQHRLVTGDYKGALEIAAGPLAKQLQQEKTTCERDRAACDARKTESQKATTMGVVLTREATNATVRVITHGVPGGPKKFLTLVERDATGWKVTARIPDAPGATLPAPVLPPAFRAMPMPVPMNAPTGSAAAPARPGATPRSPGIPSAAQPSLQLPPGHP